MVPLWRFSDPKTKLTITIHRRNCHAVTRLDHFSAREIHKHCIHPHAYPPQTTISFARSSIFQAPIMALHDKELGTSLSLQTLVQQNPSDHNVMPQEPPPAFLYSQCPTPMEEYDPTSTHPCSPFYSHSKTRASFEQVRCSKTLDTDLESGSNRYSLEPSSSTNSPRKECTAWPGQETIRQRNKDMKRERSCRPFRGLTRKQRLWAKVIIALVIVGAAVGIGVGISIAVGGTVWKNNNQQGQIG